MIYFRFHIGDWEQKTRLLSPIEKGIYVDLLTYYYSTERPIVRSNYERITRGYTEEEKKAADYVLSTFFTEKDGCYYNKRCEEEIAAWQEKSSKSKKSIKARWDREKRRISNTREDAIEASNDDSNEDSTNDTNVCTGEYTNVCTKCDTDRILTINHKPINISTNVDIKEKVKKEKKSKATCGTSFSLTEIPQDWIDAAEKIDPEIDPQKAFADFADYWRAIPGEKGRKKDWLATWRNSIRNIPDWKRKKLLKNNRTQSPSGDPWDDPNYYGESGELI